MTTISVLLILLAVHAQADMRQASLTPERIGNAKRIVVDYSRGGRGFYKRDCWLFEASGKCFGQTLLFGASSKGASFIGVSKMYDLPPETFLEVQQILLKSNFWALKRRELSGDLRELSGDLTEGGSYSSIIIECDGAEPETECPEQCECLLEFIGKLPERGRETSATDTRQESPPP
jgi:hypothetical protein